MNRRPLALFESFLPGPEGRSFRFDGLERVLTARTVAEVAPLLAEVERAVTAGRHAAGLVAFEAAPGLDPALPVHLPEALPLAWFGLFAERHEVTAGATTVPGACRLAMLPPAWSESRYTAAFRAVKEYIAAGDSYQVNLTFRQRLRFAGEPFSLYRRLCADQPAAFCAWLDLGEMVIASASPELFFVRQGHAIAMRPMKGTAPRGLDTADDLRRREELATAPKEQAENLMIVDLVRNDLGRVAATGSVAVPQLFAVESYPTLHQMTSTVTARLRDGVGLVDIFRALFPCGSVTGAPKRRSMAIIKELENGPRGPYCGAIGFVSPGDEAVFSVAIRTAALDVRRGAGEMGIGSGVTADAEAAAEYRECLQKAAFLACNAEPLQLIETLPWDEPQGYALLERHLRRLAASAAELGFACDLDAVRRQLLTAAPTGTGRHKVRLLLAADGIITVTAVPLTQRESAATPARVTLATAPIDSREPLLRHKTTWRPWYDGVLERHPGYLDVLFCNESGEVTEGTIHNLVVEREGRLVTPPVACGLLPGTLRGELVERGILAEEIVTRQELLAARRLWLINSVRGWRRVNLHSEGENG
ncbi:MAG: aminodeoxychorismate synthase component I [Desulfuromonas sp.]|nr:aminodeoxychorismate synthase component I [Desulfuromonas sp.]